MNFLFSILLSMSAHAAPIFDSATFENSLKLNFASPSSILKTDGSSNVVSGSILSSDLPASGVTAGSYGAGGLVPVLTVDSTGRLISVSETPVTFTPTGNASSFAGFDPSTSELTSFDNFQLNAFNGLNAYAPYDVAGSGSVYNFEAAFEVPASVSAGLNAVNIDSHFDRNNTGESIITGDLNALNISSRHEGSGNIPNIRSASFRTDMGTNGGTAGSINSIAASINVENGAVVQNGTGIDLYSKSSPGGIVNNYNGFNAGFDGTFDGWTSGYNTYANNASAFLNDYRAFTAGNDGTVGNNASGMNYFQGGDVTKSWTGFGAYLNGNAGDGSGSNIFGVDINIGGGGTGKTLNGNVVGYNFGNSYPVLGTNNVTGLNVDNRGDAYRFAGANIFNNGEMTEETKGIGINLSDINSRTASGLDIYMSGNVTDDARGLRINVDNLTSSSATQHVNAMEVSGGTIALRGKFEPFDSVGVEVGNGFFFDSTISHDLSGTDQIIQLMQSNLFLDNNISPGPFGLGTVMTGFISQLGGVGGKHVEDIRSMLVGTSVPTGFGHLVDKHQVITMIGFPSFGGSVVNPYRVGIEDAPGLLGQNFCDGATECWTFKSNDPNADVFFKKNLIVGGTTEHDVLNGGIVVTDKHIRVVQTVSPVATVDANAGTGATCGIDSGGTDHAMNVTLVSGSASWAAGSQCAIVFDKQWDQTPRCVFSAINSSAAVSSGNIFLSNITTTGLEIHFVNPDVSSNTYSWGVHCD